MINARKPHRTLVEFMNDRNGDHQMLVLTCHAHVATLFRAAKATVRTLGSKQFSAETSVDDALPTESC